MIVAGEKTGQELDFSCFDFSDGKVDFDPLTVVPDETGVTYMANLFK